MGLAINVEVSVEQAVEMFWSEALKNQGQGVSALDSESASLGNRLGHLVDRLSDSSLGFAIRQAQYILEEGISGINVMGTMACGKSNISEALEKSLGDGWKLYDADYCHPDSNIKKMREGKGLSDEDRVSFLENVREVFETPKHISTCSALKPSYRAFLNGQDAGVITKPNNYDLWNISEPNLGLITICMVKEFGTALAELDYAETNGKPRMFAGEQHFIHVTEDEPDILQAQYDTLIRPRPWQAITVLAEQYRTLKPLPHKYDSKKMLEDLLKCIGFA